MSTTTKEGREACDMCERGVTEEEAERLCWHHATEAIKRIAAEYAANERATTQEG